MSQAKSADDCGCTGKNGGVCEHNRIKRPRYFHGMLLDEKDFVAEQQYHAAKRRMLNRMLYGWGVVCGLDLEWKPNQKWVRILPGLAFDCFGNEIWVSDPFDVDLTRLVEASPALTQEPCADPDASETKERYLCLQYHETCSDPVPVYVSGGDCKDQTCEFSRVREGFCVKLLTSCPAGPGPGPDPDSGLAVGPDRLVTSPLDPAMVPGVAGGCLEIDCQGLEGEARRKCELLAAFCSRSLPCPDCGGYECNRHCVVLGRIDVNEKGCVVKACTNECRHYVPSARMMQYLASSLAAILQPPGHTRPFPAQQSVGNPIRAVCELGQRFLSGGDDARSKLVQSWLRGTQTSQTGAAAQVQQREEQTDGAEQIRQQEERSDAAEQIQQMEARIQAQEAQLRSQEEALSSLKSELTAKLSKSGIDARLATLEQRTGDLAQQVEGLAGGGPPAQGGG